MLFIAICAFKVIKVYKHTHTHRHTHTHTHTHTLVNKLFSRALPKQHRFFSLPKQYRFNWLRPGRFGTTVLARLPTKDLYHHTGKGGVTTVMTRYHHRLLKEVFICCLGVRGSFGDPSVDTGIQRCLPPTIQLSRGCSDRWCPRAHTHTHTYTQTF